MKNDLHKLHMKCQKLTEALTNSCDGSQLVVMIQYPYVMQNKQPKVMKKNTCVMKKSLEVMNDYPCRVVKERPDVTKLDVMNDYPCRVVKERPDVTKLDVMKR